MQVPSTPTAADAMLDRKRILDENTVHVQTRDTLLREIAQWQPVLEAIKAEIAASLGLPEITHKAHEMLSTKLLEQRDEIQRQIDVKTAAVNDIDVQNTLKLRESAASEAAIETTRKTIAALKEDQEKHEGLTRSAKEGHETQKLQIQSEIEPVKMELEQARNHLSGVRLEEEVLLNNRQQEDIRLARKGADLAIYEARVRKLMLAAGMDPDHIVV